MIIDMEVGLISRFAIGGIKNTKELKLLGYGGNNGSYASSSFEEQYYNNPETTFRFLEGRIEVWQANEEITGNTHAIGFLLPKNTMTSSLTTSAATLDIDLEQQPMRAMAESIQRLIDEMAKENGIEVPRLPNFEDRFLLYCYPLLREVYHPDINFFNVHNGARYENFHHAGLHPAFKQKNMKDAVKFCTGNPTSKLIKVISKRMIIDKYQNIATMENQDAQMASASRAISEGYSEVPTLGSPYRTRYVRKELNPNVFNQFWFLSQIFPSIDYIYQYMERADQDLNVNVNCCAEIVQFFKEKFTPKKALNLLIKGFSWNEITDAAKQYYEYDACDKIPPRLRGKYTKGIMIPKNFKNIKELHDKISAQYNEIKADEKNKDIVYTPLEFKIHGYKKDNVELILPSEGKKVVEWGKVMSHCIASYADKAAEKKCILLGVKVFGNLQYNVELKLHEKDLVMQLRRIVESRKDDLSVDENGDLILFNGLDVLSWDNEKNTLKKLYDIKQFRGFKNKQPEDWVRKTVEKMFDEIFIDNLANDHISQTKQKDHEPVQMMG